MNSDIRLDKAITLFLGEFIQTTATSYTYPLTTMRDWIGGARTLASIKPEQMIEYCQESIKPRLYAAATEHKHVKTMKTFYNWCVRSGLIDKSPAAALRSRRPPRNVERDRAMSDDELYALLTYLRDHKNPRDYTMLLFLADTGCRRGGVAGLRLRDLQLDQLTATVTEKGDKARKVVYGQPCAEALAYWLQYRAKHYPQSQDDYVFTRNGRRMEAANVSQAIRRACRAIGIRVLSAHSLRHRKGHQLSDLGTSPSVAATLLGHSDPSITLNYYYPGDWPRAEAAGRQALTDVPPLARAPLSPPRREAVPAPSANEPDKHPGRIIQFPGTRSA